MNDDAFYERFISMFLHDDSFQRTKDAFEAKDFKLMFQCAHELKGVCGNAALAELYDAVCPLVELLRGGAAKEEDARPLFERVEAAYIRAKEGISLATGK